MFQKLKSAFSKSVNPPPARPSIRTSQLNPSRVAPNVQPVQSADFQRNVDLGNNSQASQTDRARAVQTVVDQSGIPKPPHVDQQAFFNALASGNVQRRTIAAFRVPQIGQVDDALMKQFAEKHNKIFKDLEGIKDEDKLLNAIMDQVNEMDVPEWRAFTKNDNFPFKKDQSDIEWVGRQMKKDLDYKVNPSLFPVFANFRLRKDIEAFSKKYKRFMPEDFKVTQTQQRIGTNQKQLGEITALLGRYVESSAQSGRGKLPPLKSLWREGTDGSNASAIFRKKVVPEKFIPYSIEHFETSDPNVEPDLQKRFKNLSDAYDNDEISAMELSIFLSNLVAEAKRDGVDLPPEFIKNVEELEQIVAPENLTIEEEQQITSNNDSETSSSMIIFITIISVMILLFILFMIYLATTN